MAQKGKQAKITNRLNQILQVPVKRNGKLVQVSLLPGRSALILQEEILPDLQTKVDLQWVKLELLK